MDWRLQEWQKVYSLVKDYEQYVAFVSYKDISSERSKLFEALDGDVFFGMNLWPVST